MMATLESGSVVWVKLGQTLWPGTISDASKCPQEFVKGLTKKPFAIVKFFNENEYHDVYKSEHVFPYQCSRKLEYIRKGYGQSKHNDKELHDKFCSDIVTAEKLTGGDMAILKQVEGTAKHRIDYSDLGFGEPKPKKKKDDRRPGSSDIGASIYYRKGVLTPVKVHRVNVEHKVKIMEQPKLQNIDIKEATAGYRCYLCCFTCSRVNVMVWHNKMHLKKVWDYDSGITIPGRKKKRMPTSKAKSKKQQSPVTLPNTSTTNGIEESPPLATGRNASDLLMDWSDGEDEVPQTSTVTADDKKVNNSEVECVPESATTKSANRSSREVSEEDYCSDSDYPRQPNEERRPMPKQDDINSVFDALVADSGSIVNDHCNREQNFSANDSDSECSDWEKYYTKSSASEDEQHESDIKSLCEEQEAIENGAKTDDGQHSWNSGSPGHLELQQDEVPHSVSFGKSKDVLSNDVHSDRNSQEEGIGELKTTHELFKPSNESVQDDGSLHAGSACRESENAEEDDQLEKTASSGLEYKDSASPLDAYSESSQTTVSSDSSSSSELPVSKIPLPGECPPYSSMCTDNAIESPPIPFNMSALDGGSLTFSERADNSIADGSPTNDMAHSADKQLDLDAVEDEADDCQSSSKPESSVVEFDESCLPCTDSGSAYMLVAVDAHGNNIPVLPLNENSQQLMAMKISAKDGSMRTFYYDPEQVGPNVDIQNLMRHIDTSGQETVIISTSSPEDTQLPSPATTSHESASVSTLKTVVTSSGHNSSPTTSVMLSTFHSET